jgi:catechol 2,3-dioxygenase-like lactoylglutathione lyase family enzyme
MSGIENEMVLAHFIVSDDVERSRRFYTDVLGGRTVIGADFLTPPKVHETEIRAYVRDPDGYIIEVGQTTLDRGWRPPS